MTSNKEILVEKMNGEKEQYNPDKLRKSLRRVGVDKKTIEEILKKTQRILKDGVKTKKLFEFIHNELNKSRPGAGLKYNLKKAMIELRVEGGYVFEIFIGRIMENKGYNVKMNQIVQGKFISHEIDVSAEKGKEKLMVETKHHNKPWLGEKIQTALYVYARFLEVKKKFTKPMLVTNTKFSRQVIKYSKGVGIKLMGWKYPYQDSLEDNIARYKVYPITILKISQKEIFKYLKKNILTIQELKEQKGIPKETKKQVDAILKGK